MIKKQLNPKRVKIAFIVFIFFITGYFDTPKALFAQSSPLIYIAPSFQEVVLTENNSQALVEVTLKNGTNQDLRFQLEATEINQVDDEGTIGFFDKPPAGQIPSASYIDIENRELLLSKNESKTISVTVKNAQDLSPGGHYVAVVARSDTASGSYGSSFSPALSSLLLIKKEGGERYQLNLKNTTDLNFLTFTLPSNIILTFENLGNIHTSPYGLVEIKDIFGRIVNRGVINEGSKIILPGTQRKFDTKLQKYTWSYPVMFYTLDIIGESRPGNIPYRRSDSFMYISPYFLAGIVILIVILVVLLYRKKKKKHEK